MYEKFILCSNCGKKYDLKKPVFRCEKCNSSLEIVFDYNKIRKKINLEKMNKRPFNHARYLEFFPVKNLISLQEGGTPLILSKNIRKNLNFNLYFKYEAQNPTGSFKDRGSSVEISKFFEFYKKNRKLKKSVVCASTGNMGASLAAYSAATSLNCFVFTSRHAKPIKLEQILAYGARLYHVHGNYAQTAKMVEELHKKCGFYLLGDYLYRREGTKSVGFEILQQMKNVDYIFSPIGNGTLISAVWKACKEFKEMNFIRTLPKMVGIQAKGCSPVYNSFLKKSKKILPIKNPKTIANAIECGDPLDGERALKSILESNGFLEAVSDGEILKARELLAKKEGLFAEPAGAASLAGLLKVKDKIKKDSKAICLITGHGLKAPFTGVKGKVREIRTTKYLKRFK